MQEKIPNELTQKLFDLFSDNLERSEQIANDKIGKHNKLREHFDFLYKYKLLNRDQEKHRVEKITQGKNYQDANEIGSIIDWLEFRRDEQEKNRELINISIQTHQDTIGTNKIIRESSKTNSKATVWIAIATVLYLCIAIAGFLQNCDRQKELSEKKNKAKNTIDRKSVV